MKKKNVIFALLVAVASAAELLFAQAAWATVDPAVVDQTFAGKYRAPVKTSIAKAPVAVNEYPDLASLLQSLPGDSAMRGKYPTLRKGVKNWPKQRVPEEALNVKIDSCWICAVKYEHNATGDNDFHLILSNSQTPPFNHVMNMEVSGLPRTGADVARLKSVRARLLSFFQHTPSSGAFLRVPTPIHVRVEGSLYFDGDHSAGGKSDPGPSWAKPKTVWEVHPIYTLKRLD